MIPQIERMLKDLGVTQYVGPSSHRDVLETAYVTLFNGLQKPEGSIGETALTEEDAIAAFCEGLQKWLAGRDVIIWRHQPEAVEEELQHSLGKKRKFFGVYARLAAYKSSEFYLLNGASK